MLSTMARPLQPRTIEFLPEHTCFKPLGIPASELQEVQLTLDELEAVRLADLNGLYQEAAAEKMNISRSAFARILESARHKIADALIHGRLLRIEGGPIHTNTKRAGICPTDCPCKGRRRRLRHGQEPTA